MANYETHHLYAQELQQNLLAVGVLEPIPEKFRDRAGNCEYRIMYAKCDADDWAEQLKKILERGVIDCSKKNPDGKYGVRRDYTEEEKELLGWYPVHFLSPNEMMWISKWVMDDNPGYYASRANPAQNMIMHLYYEATFDGGWYMRNGKMFAKMPCIPCTVNPKEALEYAIKALTAEKLDGFADEMVNRFMSIDKAEEGRTVEQLQFCVVLDYVYFKNPEEPEDDEPECDLDSDEAPRESDPDLPF